MFAAELTYWNVSRRYVATPLALALYHMYVHASFSELIICTSFVMYIHAWGFGNFADIWIYLHLPPDRYEL